MNLGKHGALRPRFLRIFLWSLLLAEILLLVQVSSLIGIVPTMELLLLTAIAGGWLLRRQGVGCAPTVQRTLGTRRAS